MKFRGYISSSILVVLALTVQAQHGEVLSPLQSNAILTAENSGHTEKAMQSRFVYLHDTISLPFFDDFSTDRLQHHTRKINDPGVIDSLMYSIYIAGVPAPAGAKYDDDTTFTTTYNNQANLADITVVPHAGVLIDYYDLTVFPPTRLTVTAWPAENIIDSLWTFGLDHTNPTFVDYAQDTITLYIVPADLSLINYDGTPTLRACWLDDDAWVNNSWALNSPTIGTATLDGLNKHGYPHDWSFPTNYGLADFLTSAPIDLNYLAADSIYLSFFYQPQGLGNNPDPTDSLFLEFYSPVDKEWYHQWSVEGSALTDTSFTEVRIPITDVNFLVKGFQFRFGNYATLSGNLDHWHLDYILLDRNRTANGFYMQDGAFFKPVNTLLKPTFGYTSMPYEHYLPSPSAYLADIVEVEYVNRSNVTQVYSKPDVNLHYGGTTYVQVDGVTDKTVTPGQVRSFRHEFLNSPNSIVLNAGPALDSCFQFHVDFTMANNGATADKAGINDTLRFTQVLGNYYSYDDGSPEAGYGVLALGGQAAQRFTVVTADTLKGVHIHFSPVVDNTSDAGFFVMVWEATGNAPGAVIYQSPLLEFPLYYEGRNLFVSYALEGDQPLDAGEYFIGWKQVENRYLNIGFDRNTNNQSKIMYNATGSWLQTSFKGSLMIRPVFGWLSDLPTEISEPIAPPASFKLYPNPAQDRLCLETDFAGKLFVELYDMGGRKIGVEELLQRSILPTQNLQNGLYFLVISDATSGAFISSEKFLIQR